MVSRTDDTPLLIAHGGPLHGQRWPLHSGLVIGRDEKCDIQVADRQVSRRHARLVRTRQGILLEDLGSKNGTHRNGLRISEPVLLGDGDSVQIALAQQFTFMTSDATLPLEEETSFLENSQEGMLRLEKRSHRVWLGEVELAPPLSASQYRLLEVLYDHPGQVVSRSDIIAAVWGSEEAPGVTEQSVDALVRRLRDRLNAIMPGVGFIVTLRGHGLRLENPK